MDMNTVTRTLQGKELDDYFEKQIVFLKEKFVEFLSQFDASDLFHKWREMIRHIDELYNISCLLSFEERLLLESCSIEICKDQQFGKVVGIIGDRYGKDVKCRFIKTCIMLSALNYAYVRTGQSNNIVRTLGEAIDRCQEMRLYYVTMLLFVPQFAKGNRKIEFLDLLNFFQPQIDICLVNIRTAYNALVINNCIDDYKAEPQTFGFSFNYEYNHLEQESLEPERLSVVDVLKSMTKEEKEALPSCRVYQLCGYEELMDGIKLTTAVYDKYGLNEFEEYRQMVGLAFDLKPFLRDNYAFIVPQDDFRNLKEKYPLLDLTCNSTDFDDMLNARPAFFRYEEVSYSTVLFYQRYMENREQRLLEKKKKFQVDSGFAFEREITEMLSALGFSVQKSTKRIRRKEFDVVAIKDGCIYNFQCKNNFITISQQGDDWLRLTGSEIKRLNRYYEYALKKEDGRDYLLKEKLGIDTVKSYVLSRFPIITRNPRVINYNELNHFQFSMGKNKSNG